MRPSLCWGDSVAEEGLSEACPRIENVSTMKRRVSTMQRLIIGKPFVVEEVLWLNRIFSISGTACSFLFISYQLIWLLMGIRTVLRLLVRHHERSHLLFHGNTYRLANGMGRLTYSTTTIFYTVLLPHLENHQEHRVLHWCHSVNEIVVEMSYPYLEHVLFLHMARYSFIMKTLLA